MTKKRPDERNGENEGEEPNFEDPEDFVDDISDQGAYFEAIMIKISMKTMHKSNENCKFVECVAKRATKCE